MKPLQMNNPKFNGAAALAGDTHGAGKTQEGQAVETE